MRSLNRSVALLPLLLLAAPTIVSASPGARRERVVEAPRPQQQPAQPWAARQTRLEEAARQAGIGAYRRRMANGATRLYLNPSTSQHLAAIEQHLPKRSNVLEIVHFGTRGAQHTLAIFDREFVHVQYANGTNNWRIRNWGNALRPSSSKMYSSMIQLTETEGERLRTMLRNAFTEQGPEHTAGRGWESGHIKGACGMRSFNCTSFWSDMPVGDRGEPLWRVAGLRSGHWHPHSFQRSLELEGNERTFGQAVYGPKLQEFGRNTDVNHVTFE